MQDVLEPKPRRHLPLHRLLVGVRFAKRQRQSEGRRQSTRACEVGEDRYDECAVEATTEEDPGASVDKPVDRLPQERVKPVDAIWNVLDALREPVASDLYPISARLDHVALKEPPDAGEKRLIAFDRGTENERCTSDTVQLRRLPVTARNGLRAGRNVERLAGGGVEERVSSHRVAQHVGRAVSPVEQHEHEPAAKTRE